MIKSGLHPIRPDRRDYSHLHTFGLAKGLPPSFSIYDGRPIPDQNDYDVRFVPNLPPLYFGCTGETAAFDAGIQDNDLYNPKDTYDNTPPGRMDAGRDIRAVLKVMTDRGPRRGDGTFGPKRVAYFNCYGAGAITDFEAVRSALWLNQAEKRGVWVGSWWYDEFNHPRPDGAVPTPTFNTKAAIGLHCYLVTGWRTVARVVELEAIPWEGGNFGLRGMVYLDAVKYNALMAQPYTGAFTITKVSAQAPIPVGWQAVIDHWVYYIRDLLNI